jgi:hypothetical protein
MPAAPEPITSTSVFALITSRGMLIPDLCSA